MEIDIAIKRVDSRAAVGARLESPEAEDPRGDEVLFLFPGGFFPVAVPRGYPSAKNGTPGLSLAD